MYALLIATALGAAGCEGEEGPEGPQGPQGPAGTNGTNGNDGDDGNDGNDGADGQNGVTAVALQFLGRYETGVFDEGAAEIVSFDTASGNLFQVNANSGEVDIISMSDPTSPTYVSSIDVAAAVANNTSITTTLGAVNSVAVRDGTVVAVIAADAADEKGVAVFFSATDSSFLAAYEVGFLPDSVAISPDGTTVAIANEGEPNDDYTVDPVGSVTIIDISAGVASATVTDVDFTDFNAGGSRAGELDPAIRIFGIKAGNVPSTVAEDLEPEYVAFAPDSTKVFVSLQENNAMAVIDVATPGVDELWSLGFKDHNRLGNELDASDRDNGVNIRNWPVMGMYQPDTIATYAFQGTTLIVTANEGDTRDYDGFSEEARIDDLILDPTAFPDAASLQADANLGRLLTTTANGDTDGDGDVDVIYSVGARSFSIYTADGERLYDSGNQFDLITANRLEDNFNNDNDENDGDSRSDAKGGEPEAVAIGTIGGGTFAFIGLERTGGIMVYNISNPHSPRFVQYVIDRDFSEEPSLGDNDKDGIEESNPLAGDLGPESIVFIAAADSPNGKDLIVVGNEVSGTTAIYQVNIVRE